MKPALLLLTLLALLASCAAPAEDCNCCDPTCPSGGCSTPTDTSPDLERLCQHHVDCADLQMACLDGICGRECLDDWHCDDPAKACLHYMCVPKGSVPDDTVEGGDTVSQPDQTTGEDTTECTPFPGAYGAPCECVKQCVTQLCLQNSTTGTNTCTQTCLNPGDCPGADLCVKVDDNTSVCVANDAGKTANCSTGPCMQYILGPNALGACACTTTCTSKSDCPTGMACHNNSGQRYCVKVGDACSENYSGCFGSCLFGDASGFCTAVCLTANDCPTNWTCEAVDGSVKACQPPA
jgi:hypothetical protein